MGALVSLPSADCTHLPGSKGGGGDLWWRKDVHGNDEDVDDDLDGDDDLDADDDLGGDDDNNVDDDLDADDGLDGGIHDSYLGR